MAYKISDGQVILDSKMMPRAEFQQPTRKCNDVKVGFQKHLDEPSSLIEVAQKTLIFATPKLWNKNYALQRLCVYYILPEVKNIEKSFFGNSYFLVLFLVLYFIWVERFGDCLLNGTLLERFGDNRINLPIIILHSDIRV